MRNTFLIAYISINENSNSVVYESYSKFSSEILLNDKTFKIERVMLKPNEIDYLTTVHASVVIFDNIPSDQIDEAMVKKIKLISPITHFVYFCENYDEDTFLSVLQKGFEFCVSLDFFTPSLFFQTLLNIFHKVEVINLMNNVIIWGNNLSMNLIDRKVWCSGQEIEITKNEFDILKFFLEHPNTFFSKEEIFKKVWGYDDDPTGLVIQYIYKLKKKIGKDNIVSSTYNGYCFKLRESFRK
ncbi:winged helix family transcriptional regulator [Malacoplasma penetrans]|uniref:Two-component response regulator n=1 Tax=Malacoplasma penetrans (strain HF-2) TaxID=272633 RepID=Q8EWY1_MALP2|nr:winged helix-turn-helix domain-containing protein [Malacoplasma penetrans]RXY97352.1 winged helix family transcriptional regulator [Malacoplasma penetrans]BAC43859.1 putative two-component response regulator [Malacoplasma penetrans HF-2]